MVVSVVASASGAPSSSPISATPPLRMSSLAARIRSSAASTRLSSTITTGRTTTSRTTLPIHHKTIARSPSARVGGLIGQEEPAEDAAQRHHRGLQAYREAARLPGGGRGRRQRLAPVQPGDPVLQVDGEVPHQ